MREKFITALVKELLGPRGGPEEELDQSPLGEYLTGVLSPVQAGQVREPEQETGLVTGGDMGEDDTEPDADVGIPPFIPPPLDPRRRPSCMGMAFTVRAQKEPHLKICVTWARYFREDRRWKRYPRYFVEMGLKLAQDEEVLWLCAPDRTKNLYRAIPFRKQVQGEKPGCTEVSLHIRKTRIRENVFLITMHLVNELSAQEDPPGVESHIFQPQIRVIAEKDTELDSLPAGLPSLEPEHHLLFEKNRIPGRGFLCSVVWRDVDPEREGTDSGEPPFVWAEAQIIPREFVRVFSPAHIRTEFIPLVAVPAPEMDWDERYGPAPELVAEKLAQMWRPEEMRQALEPLIAGYARWLSGLEKKIAEEMKRRRDQKSERMEALNRIIERCRKVLHRMRGGLNLLLNDRETRLAFCFACRAMDLQSRWTRGEGLKWRPFQLAFILMNVESLASPDCPDRRVCDLLWVPTGGGKTEAYLGLTAFALALRRRRALSRRQGDRTGAGVSVLSRYTLRLLTIQQFRRALALITACEWLRVDGLLNGRPAGWRPEGYPDRTEFLWGSTPFSAGLWVGGHVTPNSLDQAIRILRGESSEEGEPAQILNCPACGAVLAVPAAGLEEGTDHEIHFVVRLREDRKPDPSPLCGRQEEDLQIKKAELNPHSDQRYATLTLVLHSHSPISSSRIETLWEWIRQKLDGLEELCAVSPSRPGYFLRWYISGGKRKEYDFNIYCPNPRCPLQRPWCGGRPAGQVHATSARGHSLAPSSLTGAEGELRFPDGNRFIHVQEPFRLYGKGEQFPPFVADRIPIFALTVDEQIYSHVPSLVIATADKFARPPFEKKAAHIFGQVNYHDPVHGYDRRTVGGRMRGQEVPPLDPPDLILQDELHLVEGPLGSLAGLYETAVEHLCRGEGGSPVKYVASTATIRRADDQVRSLFERELLIFPPPGTDIHDRFFVRESKARLLDDSRPGRVYAGVCTPGVGLLTTARVWAVLLETGDECLRQTGQSQQNRVDPYWTVTGYFNSIRELAYSRSLYRQDIPERLGKKGCKRLKARESCLELSSRTNSTDLPSVLTALKKKYPAAPDALFTTSMFGTGIDIKRLALMVVHGQPKTTSAYIQATGRVGRERGALVVTIYRAARPRDLNHYEFFCAYHSQLHRFVEPVTVAPFSPQAVMRAAGPVMVFMLRHGKHGGDITWYENRDASRMAERRNENEVKELVEILVRRAGNQPKFKQPDPIWFRNVLEGGLDRWQQLALIKGKELVYSEPTHHRQPSRWVVLGSPAHTRRKDLECVFENVPSSLREIEETLGFEV